MIAIRPEEPGDVDAIRNVVTAAFDGHPHSDGSEPVIVDGLRRDGDLSLSLVAEDDGAVVGHVAFSPVKISDGSQGWFGLGPVAVVTERQGEGIGGALIETGLAELRSRGARGVVLLGDPAYYDRFGFAHDPALAFPGPPAEYFQCLVLKGESPRGTVRYAPAFG